MSSNRLSYLQKEILLRIYSMGSIESISLSARLANVSRESYSRSLHSLDERGLVYKNESKWCLTGEGRQLLFEAMHKLEKEMERTGIKQARLARLVAENRTQRYPL